MLRPELERRGTRRRRNYRLFPISYYDESIGWPEDVLSDPSIQGVPHRMGGAIS